MELGEIKEMTAQEAHAGEQEDEDCIMTVPEFRSAVEAGAFIDYDGFGRPIKDGVIDETVIVLPSKVAGIPEGTTQIIWFNR